MRRGAAVAGTVLALILAPDLAPGQSDSKELVARGRRLVERADCGECHTPLTADGARDPDHDLAGHVAGRPVPSPTAFRDPRGPGIAYAKNLTPDPDTGLGRWTLADFRRALREGIGGNGQPLNPKMPWQRFNRFFSDEDIAAIWAYLKTVSPARNPVPPSTPFVPRP